MTDPDNTEACLHAVCMHPDFEYVTTDGPRKAFDETPPYADEGGLWERNVHVGRGGWDRFDYHEEAYWMRRRTTAPPEVVADSPGSDWSEESDKPVQTGRRWVDLDELRRDIAADAKGRALAAGLEGIKVYVRISEPNRRGQRVIEVDVDHQERGLVRR